MKYEDKIQSVLDEIDIRITERIKADELARKINYSLYHFCRVFMAVTGMPIMAYVTRRKLEHALYDLSQGRKIIDVAMDYGFETHMGFTKAFKKCFGCPPSLYRLRIMDNPPRRATVESIKLRNIKHGGFNMNVQIKEISSFSVAGVFSRHSMPDVKRSADIPAFWNTISMDYGKHLSRLYDAFKPARHGEYGICFNIDENKNEFYYMLGVEFDKTADDKKIEADMKKIDISGGIYAVFTTPTAPAGQYPKAIADTWTEILTKWLPDSKYKYDETRLDFEAYDERDHSDENGGTVQMDIYVPVKIK